MAGPQEPEPEKKEEPTTHLAPAPAPVSALAPVANSLTPADLEKQAAAVMRSQQEEIVKTETAAKALNFLTAYSTTYSKNASVGTRAAFDIIDKQAKSAVEKQSLLEPYVAMDIANESLNSIKDSKINPSATLLDRLTEISQKGGSVDDALLWSKVAKDLVDTHNKAIIGGHVGGQVMLTPDQWKNLSDIEKINQRHLQPKSK